MFKEGKKNRNVFSFSLGGMTTKNAVVVAPAIADDRINKVWDERLSRTQEDRRDTTRQIEDILARYFAPGRCQAV